VQVGGNDYHIVFTPGHAIGHICVFCPQLSLAFTGDHILQRITPNISIHSDRHPLHKNERYNPLSDFFLSLEKTRQLGFTLGLPSHGGLLTDPAGCIDELLSHHTERLEIMLLIFPFFTFSQDLCGFPHIPSCNLFTFNH